MLKLDNSYSDYVDTSDPKYPGGKAIDASTGESVDGTPLLAKWMNDVQGSRQALVVEAFGSIGDISGEPDNVDSSDVLKAIKKITEGYTDSKVSEEASTRSSGDDSTLSSAKSYADLKVADEASSRAKADTDIFVKTWSNTVWIQAPAYEEGGITYVFPAPDEVFSASLHEGWRWKKVPYKDIVFRAEGWNAQVYGIPTPQGDAIRNIEGRANTYMINHTPRAGSGAINTNPKEIFNCGGTETLYGQLSNYGLYFNASRVVPTANENRMINNTARYWRLVKI